MSVKGKIKNMIPCSSAKIERYYKELKKENEELKQLILQLQKQEKKNFSETCNVHNDTRKIRDELHNTFIKTSKVQTEVHDIHSDAMKLRQEVHDIHDKDRSILDEVKIVDGNTRNVMNIARNTSHAADESVWGHIFRDAICNSEWLHDQCFFPGRWAVGYQYLYVLYRVLNGVKPSNILELGLGQSTRMISQYVEFNKMAMHRVVEHDSEWISFFKQDNQIVDRTEIVKLDLGKESFEDDDEVLVYKDFYNTLSDRKYDFISIDAPFGGGANIYARVDSIALIPECLADSFIIMVDDANRDGEKNMIECLKKKLSDADIPFETGHYCGNKTTYVIASPDKKFVCSL
jgi:uncharacterized protein YdaT